MYQLKCTTAFVLMAMLFAGNVQAEPKATAKQLLDINWIEQRLAKVGIEKLIADYQDHKELTVMIVRDALVLSKTILEQHPESLRNQLQARLVSYKKEAALKPFQTLPVNKGTQLYLHSPTLTQAGDTRLKSLVKITKMTHYTKKYTLSPDGKQIVIATRNGLQIWDRHADKLIKVLMTLPNSFVEFTPRLKYTPDGKKIVTNYITNPKDNPLTNYHVWDVSSGKLEGILQTNKKVINGIAMMFNSKSVVAVTEGNKIGIWDIATRKFVKEIASLKSKIYYFAISHDDQLVATYQNRTITVWEIKTGKLLHTLSLQKDKDFPGNFSAMGFSPDSKSLLFANHKGLLKRWEIKTKNKLILFKGNATRVQSFAFPAGGKQLVTVSRVGSIKLWNLNTGALIRELFKYKFSISRMAITSNCEHLLFTTSKGLKSGDLKNMLEHLPITQQDHLKRIVCSLVTPDGKYGVSSTGERIVIKNLATNQIKHLLVGSNQLFTRAILCTPDSKKLLACSHQSLHIWDIETGKLLHELPFKKEDGKFECMMWAKNGKHLWVGGYRWRMELWDLEKKKRLKTVVLEKGNHYIKDMYLTADGSKIIIRGYNYFGIFDTKTEKLIKRFGKLDSKTSYMVILPGENEILYSSRPNVILRMGLESDEGISISTPFLEHEGNISDADISPNGKYVVSTSDKSSLQLWDIKNKKALATYYFDARYLKCSFSSDGKAILVSDSNGYVHYLKIQNLP